jgi:hypothetical protein
MAAGEHPPPSRATSPTFVKAPRRMQIVILWGQH